MTQQSERQEAAKKFVDALETELPGDQNVKLRAKLRRTALNWARAKVQKKTLEDVIGKALVEATVPQKRGAAQAMYCVMLDTYDNMESLLLLQIISDAGSINKASKILGIPRSSLAAKVKRHRPNWPSLDKLATS